MQTLGLHFEPCSHILALDPRFPHIVHQWHNAEIFMQSLDPRKKQDSYKFLWCQDLKLDTTYSIWEFQIVDHRHPETNTLHMDLFLPTQGFIFLYFKSTRREAAKHANHTCRLPNLFWRLSLTLQSSSNPIAIKRSWKNPINSNKTLDFPWFVPTWRSRAPKHDYQGGCFISILVKDEIDRKVYQ